MVDNKSDQDSDYKYEEDFYITRKVGYTVFENEIDSFKVRRRCHDCRQWIDFKYFIGDYAKDPLISYPPMVQVLNKCSYCRGIEIPDIKEPDCN